MATDGSVNRWNGVAYNAAQERRLMSPLLMPGPASAPFSARGGRRVNGAGLAVSVSGSPENWFVTPGSGVLYDAGYATQGPWEVEIPAQVSGVMPARPSTGQSRIDLIVARIYDSDISVGAVKEVKIERVGGTAGTTPSAPSTPALSLLLATLTVPASGTVTVTPSTAVTVAAGGILPVATTAERDALSAYRGLVIDNGQVGKLQRHNGTTWKDLVEDDYTSANLTILSGYEAEQTTTPKVEKDGRWVAVSGKIGPTGAGTNFGTGAVFKIANVPAGFRPPTQRDFQISSSSAPFSMRGFVEANGDITVVTGSTAGPYASLDALAWLIP